MVAKKYTGLLRFAWLIVCVIAGYLVLVGTYRYSQEIHPISFINNPVIFYYIGFDESNKPIFLHSERTRNPDNHLVLMNRERHTINPVSFYIEKASIPFLEQQLDEQLPGMFHSQSKKYIQLQSDDPVKKTQVVRLTLGFDELMNIYVYSVDGNKVHPLAYGDMTRSEIIDSTLLSFICFIVLFPIGWLLIAKHMIRKT